MNRQLAFPLAIEATDEVSVNSSAVPKTRSYKKRGSAKSTMSDQSWWKLSNQERQQGLAGVRAIRAILQKTQHPGDNQFAKAS